MSFEYYQPYPDNPTREDLFDAWKEVIASHELHSALEIYEKLLHMSQDVPALHAELLQFSMNIVDGLPAEDIAELQENGATPDMLKETYRAFIEEILATPDEERQRVVKQHEADKERARLKNVVIATIVYSRVYSDSLLTPSQVDSPEPGRILQAISYLRQLSQEELDGFHVKKTIQFLQFLYAIHILEKDHYHFSAGALEQIRVETQMTPEEIAELQRKFDAKMLELLKKRKPEQN